jgi:hypothetical protein
VSFDCRSVNRNCSTRTTASGSGIIGEDGSRAAAIEDLADDLAAPTPIVPAMPEPVEIKMEMLLIGRLPRAFSERAESEGIPLGGGV